MAVDVLPTSLARTPRGVRVIRGIVCEPYYCANCGTFGGHTGLRDFCFWLCVPCHERYGTPAGMLAIPDALWWDKVNQAQVEEFGRVLAPHEQAEALKQRDHLLAVLARGR